jgi:hypothetical protein
VTHCKVFVVLGCQFFHRFATLWENVLKEPKLKTFAHPKEPHAQEAGIAACSPSSQHVKYRTEYNNVMLMYLEEKMEVGQSLVLLSPLSHAIETSL